MSPALTFYINESEKKEFRKYADERGITPAKLASQIVRAWVQQMMELEEDE